MGVKELLARIEALEAENRAWQERWDMAEGRRAKGVRAIEGFTETQTQILRIICARGRAEHANYACLYRHMSNIRAKLSRMKLAIEFRTHVGEGYELIQGKDILAALLRGETTPKQLRRGA